MSVFNHFKRLAGKVAHWTHSGLNVAKRVAGKVSHAFDTVRNIAGKVSKVPYIAPLVEKMRQEFPIINKGVAAFEAADRIQKKVNDALKRYGQHAGVPGPPYAVVPYRPVIHAR
jgi:hypothetical protein